MKGSPVIGSHVGNGAAINVELGFVPEMVEFYNATDGTPYVVAFLGWVVPFSSGGTTEITAGAKIKGATSGAYAIVKEVLVSSGTWAGGDAAGFFTLVEGSLVGTFQSENVYIDNDATSGTNDATVTANVVHNCAITTAAASATGTSAISRYEGVAGSNKAGFTIGSALAVEAKLLRYRAHRGDA
jgi:hypothetical protein